MQGAVSLRDLAAMREDQHAELATWVRELNRPAAATGTTGDDALMTRSDEPLMDFDEEMARGAW